MKTYTVTARAVRHRGLVAPLDKMLVTCAPERIGESWQVLRPLLAVALYHVKTVAIVEHGLSYALRQQRVPHQLRLLHTGRGWRGWSYGSSCRVYVGKLHADPLNVTYPRYKDMPEFSVNDWREHLIALVSHEMWHRWSKEPNGKRQEFDCEMVSIDAVDRWRKQQNKPAVADETDCERLGEPGVSEDLLVPTEGR
jgi:hypothetical protein